MLVLHHGGLKCGLKTAKARHASAKHGMRYHPYRMSCVWQLIYWTWDCAAYVQVTSEGKVAIVDVPDYASACGPMRASPGMMGDALYVWVGSRAHAQASADAAAVAAPPPGAKPAKGAAAAPTDPAALMAKFDEERQTMTTEDGNRSSSSEVYHAVLTQDEMMDLVSVTREALAVHVPHVMPPPYKPLVVAGAFGTGKRKLLQRLFDALPGRFAVPVVITTREQRPNVSVRIKWLMRVKLGGLLEQENTAAAALLRMP